MKHLFYFFLSLASCFSLQAQIELPLQGNPVLRRYYAEQEAGLPGNEAARGPGGACGMLEQAGKIYIEAGAMRYIDTNIDTAGLGSEAGQLSCLNCDGNPIGQAVIVDDSLAISAAADILGVEYSFSVEFCNPNGCRSKTFTVVGRRRGRHYFPPAIALPSEGRAMAEGQASLLPGPLACNAFIDGDDRYEGRDQRFYFTTYLGRDSSFHYDAGRYAGVDSVFLVLCDTFAICDTFHFAFRIQRDTIKLSVGGQEVFMDDFSGEGPATDPLLWLDTDPYVNQAFGVNPPTTGVATFDGLGPKGRPYGGGLGAADRLTSTYLDLAALPGDVFLSFWVQPGGLGERPRPQDELVLEYRDFNGDWDEFISIVVDSFPVAPGQISPFRFFSFPIPALYKHGAFQFRLTNYNNRSGINNIWHIDYIRLGQLASNPAITDLAFTAPPRSILANYSSMPWWHFKGIETTELDPVIEVRARSLSDQDRNAEPSFVRLEELSTGVELFSESLFGSGAERNFLAGVFKERDYDLRGTGVFEANIYTSYLNLMSGATFDGPERLEFRMEYSLATSQTTGPGYESVLRNDRAAASTIFDNYFAYDDGTAESALIAQEDDQIAVRFTSTVDDTLRAVRIHFPHMISDISNQEFNLKIWTGSLDDEPELVMSFLKPFYPDRVLDTLQGYTTYPLAGADGNLRPLALPAGDFYIGWEQLTGCTFTDCIPVGLDKNHPEGQAVSYFKRGNSDQWQAFSELGIPIPAGALMLRPVVGSETPGPTSTDEPRREAFSLKVFPNPARDVLNIYLPEGDYGDYRAELYNGLGQLVQQGVLQPQLNLEACESGLYLLRVTNRHTREWVQQRVVKMD